MKSINIAGLLLASLAIFFISINPLALGEDQPEARPVNGHQKLQARILLETNNLDIDDRQQAPNGYSSSRNTSNVLGNQKASNRTKTTRPRKGPRSEVRLSNLWSMFLPDSAAADNEYEDPATNEDANIGTDTQLRGSTETPMNVTSNEKTDESRSRVEIGAPAPFRQTNETQTTRQYPQLITGALTTDIGTMPSSSESLTELQSMANVSQQSPESQMRGNRPQDKVEFERPATRLSSLANDISKITDRKEPLASQTRDKSLHVQRHRVSTSESRRLSPIPKQQSQVAKVEQLFQRQNQTQLIQGIKYPMAQASTLSISTHDAAPSSSDLVLSRAQAAGETQSFLDPAKNLTSSPSQALNDDQVVQTEYQSQDEILRQVTSAINFERELSLTKQPEGHNHRASEELEPSLMPDGANRMFKVGSTMDELMSHSLNQSSSSASQPSPLDIIKSNLNATVASSEVRGPDDIDKNFDILAGKLRQLALQSQRANSQQSTNSDQPSWLRRPLDDLNKESFLTHHGATLTQLTGNLLSSQNGTLPTDLKVTPPAQGQAKSQAEVGAGVATNQTLLQLEKIRELLSKHVGKNEENPKKDSSPNVDSLLKQLIQVTKDLNKDQKSIPPKTGDPKEHPSLASNLGWRPLSNSIALSPANLMKANNIKHPIKYTHLDAGEEEEEYAISELADLLANSQPDEEAQLLAHHKTLGLSKASLKGGAYDFPALGKPRYPSKHQPRTKAQSSIHYLHMARPMADERKIGKHQYELLPYGQMGAGSQHYQQAQRIKSPHPTHMMTSNQRQLIGFHQPGAYAPFHHPVPHGGRGGGQQHMLSHRHNKYQATLLHNPSSYITHESDDLNSLYGPGHQYSYIHSGSVSTPTQAALDPVQLAKEQPKLVAITESKGNPIVDKHPAIQPKEISLTPVTTMGPVDSTSPASASISEDIGSRPKSLISTADINLGTAQNPGLKELDIDTDLRLSKQAPQNLDHPTPMIINHQQSTTAGHSPSYFGEPKTHKGLGQEMSQLVGAQQLAPNVVSGNGNMMTPPIRYREVSIYRPFGYQSHHAIAYQASPTMAALFPALSQAPRPGLLRHMGPLRSRLQESQRILGPLLSPPAGQMQAGQQLVDVGMRHHRPVVPIQGQFQSQATYSAAPLPITAVRQHYIRIGNQMNRRQSPQDHDWQTTGNTSGPSRPTKSMHAIPQELYHQAPVDGDALDEIDNLDHNFEEASYMPMDKLIQSSVDREHRQRIANHRVYPSKHPIRRYRAEDIKSRPGRRLVEPENRQQLGLWMGTKSKTTTTRAPVACTSPSPATNSTTTIEPPALRPKLASTPATSQSSQDGVTTTTASITLTPSQATNSNRTEIVSHNSTMISP